MTSNSTVVSLAVSDVVGSSNRMMRASEARTLAISTSWRSRRQALDRRPGRHRQADVGQQFPRPVGHAPMMDERQPAETRKALDKDVLGDRQVGEQVELLVDEADAGRRGVGRPLRLVEPAAEVHGAAFRTQHAAHDVHQRRLAGAVLADQAEHAAGMEIEVDAVEHLHAEEGLADAAEGKQCVGHDLVLSGFGWRPGCAPRRAAPPPGSPRP